MSRSLGQVEVTVRVPEEDAPSLGAPPALDETDEVEEAPAADRPTAGGELPRTGSDLGAAGSLALAVVVAAAVMARITSRTHARSGGRTCIEAEAGRPA